MNCECFYVVKDGSLEKARELATNIERLVGDAELFTCAISQVTKEFTATPDYDNFGKSFKVKEGSWLVFVSGKYHVMCEIRPRNARRGFPKVTIDDDYDGWFENHITDVEML